MDNGLEGEISVEGVQGDLTNGTFADLPEVEQAANEYLAAVVNYDTFQANNAETEAQYLQYFGQYKLELEAAEGTKIIIRKAWIIFPGRRRMLPIITMRRRQHIWGN